jgi:hypothetical protein
VAPPPQLEAAAQLLGEHLAALRAARLADSASNLNLNAVADSCKQRGGGGGGVTQVAPSDAKVLAAALTKGLALGGGQGGNNNIHATASSKGSPRQLLLSPKQQLLSPKPYQQQQVIQVRALEEGSEEEEDLSCTATDQV